MEDLFRSIRSAFNGSAEDQDGYCQELVEYLKQEYGTQNRYTHEPYLHYVGSMARRLSAYNVDRSSLTAALIWGLLEINPAYESPLRKRFGKEAVELASGLLRLSTIDLTSDRDAQKEKVRRLILALARDVRVVFLRLMDRAHVLAEIDHYPSQNPQVNARIAREVYAPLANRLGIGRLRSELENDSLKILHPRQYEDIHQNVVARSSRHEVNVERIKGIITEQIREHKIEAEIKGRVKTVNSIYRKMQAQNIDFSGVYDVIGLRVITKHEHVQDCYAVLGLIHSLWKPIPHRFKDFLAVPKENGYQSIHTSVVGPDGLPLEFQIRTAKMDYIAEVGLAAHWRYKEPGATKLGESDSKFSWMRKVMAYLTSESSNSDVVEIFKVDMFPTEVYVFTPNGDVKSLPAGSTIVDFAYSVHSEVGFHCQHGKINNRLVPLKTKLQNGDIVEIVTHRKSHPHAGWLDFVRTSTARNKIRSYLRVQARDSMIKSGSETLKRELRRHRIPIKGVFESDEFLDVVKRSGFNTSDDLFAAIGFSEYSSQHVINRLIAARVSRDQAEERESEEQVKELVKPGVRVMTGTKIETRFARCCEPMPGEKIVGYITHGRGLTIHSAVCVNLRKLEKNRIIPVSWDKGDSPNYPERIVFEGYQDSQLLPEITRVLVEHGVVLVSQKMETVDRKHSYVRGVLLIELKSPQSIDKVLAGLRAISSIKKASQSRSRKSRRK